MLFIPAPNQILKFAILRRQPSNDLVRSARRVNRQFRMKKYCLADLKLVLVHRISPPSRRRDYHRRGLNDSPRRAHWEVTAESGSDGELFVIDAYALSPLGLRPGGIRSFEKLSKQLSSGRQLLRCHVLS